MLDKNGQPSKQSAQVGEDSRLWRGVFSPVPERESLFTVEVDLRTADLPAWEPQITISPRWVADDDE